MPRTSPKFLYLSTKSKNPSPVKETGFPLQLPLATPLPFPQIAKLGRKFCAPPFQVVCPEQASSERSNKSIGKY